MNVVEVTRELDREQVPYELIPHRRTETASEEAAELHLDGDEIAKTIVLVGEHGYVRAVLPASERLDLHKARALLGLGKEARLATEAELAGAYPMFELGAAPPFGGPAGDRAVLDRRLARREWLVLEAGTHEESVRVRTRDLIRLTDPQIADICETELQS